MLDRVDIVSCYGAEGCPAAGIHKGRETCQWPGAVKAETVWGSCLLRQTARSGSRDRRKTQERGLQPAGLPGEWKQHDMDKTDQEKDWESCHLSGMRV